VALATLAAAAESLGCRLDDDQLDRFERYRALVLEWNQQLNLTGIRDPDAFEVLHFVDAVAALAVLPAEARPRVVDVGTGAGLPGLALRIARPDLHLTLLDSVAKKTRVVGAIVAELGLADAAVDGGPPVEVLTARAEDVGRDPARRESWDVALARAVGTVVVLAELCLPLVRVGGLTIAWKKRDVADEIAVAGRGVSILGGRRLRSEPVDLPGLPADRQLVMLSKERPTPHRYPRLPGVPEHQPLVGEVR
jgi:16S rRNA (guanine527-N7)-methyltransferase